MRDEDDDDASASTAIDTPQAYHGSTDAFVSEDDVYEALDVLVAIEPTPTAPSREAYQAAIAPYEGQIAAAMATLHRFAKEAEPSLENMQRHYYGFVNQPRYLVTGEVAAVVTWALNEAWNGVGSWRR